MKKHYRLRKEIKEELFYLGLDILGCICISGIICLLILIS